MSKRRKKKPDYWSHSLRRPIDNFAYPEAWFYNDKKGITVVVGGKLARLSWRVIAQAARRVGVAVEP